MKLFQTLLAICITLTLAMSAQGTHYPLTKNAAALDGETADVVQFFSYACKYCYNMDSSIDLLKSETGLTVKLIPVSFGLDHFNAAALAFIAAEKLGVESQLHTDLMHAIHSSDYNGKYRITDKMTLWAYEKSLKNGLGAMPRIYKEDHFLDYFEQQGIDPEKVQEIFELQSTKDEIAKNDLLAGELGLRGTPTFIVNKKYVITGDDVRGKEFLDLIQQLMEEE